MQGPSHQQLWGIRPDEIRIMKNEDGSDCILGSGAFGSVYKAQMNGVDTVAVKVRGLPCSCITRHIKAAASACFRLIKELLRLNHGSHAIP